MDNTQTIKSSIDLDEFEIVKSGNAQFPVLQVLDPGAGKYRAGEAITTVAHNLGYTPAFIVNISLWPGSGSTYSYTCPYQENVLDPSFGAWTLLQAYTDQTNLYLLTDYMVYHTQTNGTSGFIAQYFLLKEKVKRAI